MRIYLDDERNPKIEQFDVITRSFGEFLEILEATELKITYVSFDHDLGEDSLTGYDCAKALVELDIKYSVLAKDFTFNVHSANPVGAKNIQMYLDQYLETHRVTVSELLILQKENQGKRDISAFTERMSVRNKKFEEQDKINKDFNLDRKYTI